MLLLLNSFDQVKNFQIMPIDPAVKPTTKKKVNSNKSLGKEFTIRLN